MFKNFKLSLSKNPRNLESWYLPLQLFSKSLDTSNIIFAVRSRKSLCRMYIKPPFLQLILWWTSNYQRKDKMLVDCMLSQPYQSLIEFQNHCLVNSNSNSVIGSTVNQFETPVRVDISTRHFSSSFISVVTLSMTLCIFLLLTSLSQFWVSLDYLWLCRAVNFFINAVSSDVILLEFINLISAVSWNIGMVNPPYLVGTEIRILSLSLHMWHPVTAGINFFLIVLSRGSSKWRMFGMVFRK